MENDNLQESIQELRDKARERYIELKKKADEKREYAEKYIGENPKKSLMMAAGIGAMIGLAIGCAMSNRKDYRLI